MLETGKEKFIQTKTKRGKANWSDTREHGMFDFWFVLQISLKSPAETKQVLIQLIFQ